jgi:PAS domain S-box-containing protein
MGMGVVYQSSDGRIIDANPAAQEMLGLTLDQLQGRTSMDPRWRAVRADRSPCPGEEHPAMVALRTGRPVTAQVMGVFSPSTGSYRWLLVTATPEFREGQATPWRVFTTFADITEVYEAERRLEASEDKYRRLAENAPVIIYRLNLSPPSVDYISPAAVRLMGYSPEELYGDPGLALRLIHPDDAGVLQDMATGNEGLDGPVELRWVTRSGDVVVTEQHMFVVRDDEGRPTALEGVALDVSARRAAEDEVRRTLTVLQATLESVAEGIVVADLEDDWLVVNSQFTDMWGLPATGESRPAIRRRTEAFGALKDPVAFASLFAELHDDPAATWAGDVGFRDGRVLAATSRPLFIAGEINGRVWSYRDVTVTRVAEQETRELAARLSRTLDGALSAMGGVVELRDPYTSGHQKRTAALAEAIAVEMGLPARVIHTIRVAASIHDIGQLLVPAEVLTRPRSLTAVEMELVKGHAAAGYDVLSRIAFDAPIADVVLQHHERLDGSGYPNGTSGPLIMLEARIVAVADVVEAMSSHRPYRPALGVEAALKEIHDGAGVLYDREVVAACECVFAQGFAFDG